MTLRKIGMQIINERKAEISQKAKGHVGKASEGDQGRDLLTVLLRANMAEDLPDSQRLTEEDMLARTSRIFVDTCCLC